MTLHRPALPLGPGPRGVQDARRWVTEVCTEVGHPELVECAQLGISELVTNALLHGRAPIEVRVGGTEDHPRLEVHDTSPEAPVMPRAGAGDGLGTLDLEGLDGLEGLEGLEGIEDALLTFGRGLSIVARAASAWGADLEAGGKVVWFVPAPDFAEDAGAEGVVTGQGALAVEPPPIADPVDVRVIGVPLVAYAAFRRHLRELRREVRLLALAHESSYPLAKDLSDLFGSLEQHLREVVGTDQVDRALAEGLAVVDLDVTMARPVTQTLSRFVELLDLADEFCREERLLSLARTPAQRDFERWLLGEFVRQGRGERPQPWAEGHEPARRSVV